MKRLWLLPILLLGLSAGSAFGSTHDSGKTSAVGSISALSTTSISVDGKHDLTCKLGARSPEVTSFKVSDRVGILCRNGVLRKIRLLPLPAFKPTPETPAAGSPTASATAASIAGEIEALSQTSIKVEGDRELTCKLTDGSPSVAAFKLGDKVRIACGNGVLTAIVKVETPAAPPAGDREPATVYGTGTISVLDTASIAVTGEHSLSCTVGASSPKLGDYKLGDKVAIGCRNGVLIGIAKIATAPTPTPAPAPAPPAPAPVITTIATGAITALTDGRITVFGDRETTCVRGESSPRLGDYKVGDKVKLYCLNGVLAGIVKTETAPPPPAPVVTTATGKITLISDGRITVFGDRETSCSRGTSSPALTGYVVGDTATLTCTNGVLTGIVKVLPM